MKSGCISCYDLLVCWHKCLNVAVSCRQCTQRPPWICVNSSYLAKSFVEMRLVSERLNATKWSRPWDDQCNKETLYSLIGWALLQDRPHNELLRPSSSTGPPQVLPIMGSLLQASIVVLLCEPYMAGPGLLWVMDLRGVLTPHHLLYAVVSLERGTLQSNEQPIIVVLSKLLPGFLTNFPRYLHK